MIMTGKIMIAAGMMLILLGAVLLISENNHFKWWSWFGNLPGDIKAEKENFKFYFPLTSMILISIILSLLLNLLKKIF